MTRRTERAEASRRSSIERRLRGFFSVDPETRQANLPRPRRGLTWPLWGMLAVPLLFLAIAARQNYRLVQMQAEQQVLIEAGELREHAINAFKTYALALTWVDDRTRGRSWADITQDTPLRHFFADLERLPPIDAIWLSDAEGHTRALGQSSTAPPIDQSERRLFTAQKGKDAGLYVSRDHLSRLTKKREFEVSRRRTAANGGFDGIVGLDARAEYFLAYYRTVSSEKRYAAFLLRSDGAMLVHYPATSALQKFPPEGHFIQSIAASPDRGVFRAAAQPDATERIYGYSRVAGYPIYVVFCLPTSGVLGAWRNNLIDYLLFAVPAGLALFCMTWFAVRQLQRQQLASWRWRATAGRLRREMDRRELAEAELRQAQKMEALGQLTGGVAHDFNNLLTVLQGCLEMLSGRQRNDALQGKVDMALRTIERSAGLTHQLLAFARRQPLAKATLDLNAQLSRMTELLAQTVGRKVAIETDFATDLHPLEADATQLELAVINLAINARDAMPRGGVLRLRTFNTIVPNRAYGVAGGAGEFVGLEVSDTGIGMIPEVLARAFEPLFTTKGPGKGTGLGLSMVYGFARQSGGTATIRSEPGHGTAVLLLLPSCRGSRGGEPARDLPRPGGA